MLSSTEINMKKETVNLVEKERFSFKLYKKKLAVFYHLICAL